MGQVGILNVGIGDTKLTFDPSKPDEVANASRIVKDMLRRGYAIFIEVGRNDKGPIYQRAHDFDEATAEYIVVGTPDAVEQDNVASEPPATPRRGRKAGQKPAPRRVAANSTDAIAVARTAGG